MCFPALIGALGSVFGVGGGAAAGTSGALSTIATVAGLAGSAISAVGAVQAANAQAAAAKAQAQFNRRQAEIEEQRGRFEAERAADRQKRILAAQRAGFLASGVALQGSPTAVIADTTAETGLDIRAIQYSALLNARNFRDQARINDMNAKLAKQAGPINALSSLASGVTRLVSSYQTPYRIA